MNLRENELGYLEVWPKPTENDLERHYNNKYYAADKGQYSASYTDDEILQKNFECEEALHFAFRKKGTLLDLGCGEGFFLSGFQNKGWTVEGADFTTDGVNHFFPELTSKVHAGSLFKTIDRLIAAGHKYDMLICNNVLEHVLDPQNLLEGIKRLMHPESVCRIVVPNDNSYLQAEIVRRGFAKPHYWLADPEHQSYFNADNLQRVIRKCGFQIESLLADFPIDMFLFNRDSNYQKDAAKGKNCHYSRVMIENALAKEGIEKLVAFREGCARAGIGRTLIAYCSLPH